MDKINIKLEVEQYKNVHLLLHNLIELSGSLANQNEIFKDVNNSLKLIKTTLEVKS